MKKLTDNIMNIEKGEIKENAVLRWSQIECIVKKANEPTSFETQVKQVLKHLLNNPITSWEAIGKYSITRLSAVIYTLRKDHNIVSTWKHNGKKRFVEYKLIK